MNEDGWVTGNEVMGCCAGTDPSLVYEHNIEQMYACPAMDKIMGKADRRIPKV